MNHTKPKDNLNLQQKCVCVMRQDVLFYCVPHPDFTEVFLICYGRVLLCHSFSHSLLILPESFMYSFFLSIIATCKWAGNVRGAFTHLPHTIIHNTPLVT